VRKYSRVGFQFDAGDRQDGDPGFLSSHMQ
jgi:hypothetical protein